VRQAQKSGLFSPAEIDRIRQNTSTAINALIKAFDINHDNKVSKDELIASVEKVFVGHSVNDAPEFWKAAAASLFESLDSNKNGELNEDEYVKGIVNVAPSVPADRVKAAFRHVKGGGKFDLPAFRNVLWTWATSPNAEPEVEVLTSFLHKN